MNYKTFTNHQTGEVYELRENETPPAWVMEQIQAAKRILSAALQAPSCTIYWRLYLRWVTAPEDQQPAHLRTLREHIKVTGCPRVGMISKDETWITEDSHE